MGEMTDPGSKTAPTALDAGERERRRHAFALAVHEAGAQGPGLDPQFALSPRADELRAQGIDEVLLGAELKRGLVDSKTGSDHLKYLRLAASWLGYRDPEARAGALGAPEGAATLAAAVAGAVEGARAAGLLSERARAARPVLGGEILERGSHS